MRDNHKLLKMSASLQLLNVTMYSGSQGLQSVSCYFYAFGPGSVKAIMDAVAKTSPSVAPTETQITQNLIDGIQNYVHFNGGLDSNPFYFSLSDPIQVSGKCLPRLNRSLTFTVNRKFLRVRHADTYAQTQLRICRTHFNWMGLQLNIFHL